MRFGRRWTVRLSISFEGALAPIDNHLLSRAADNLSLFRAVQEDFTRRLVLVNVSKLWFALTWVLFPHIKQFYLMYIYLAYTHYILSKYQKNIIKLVWYNLLCVITAPAKNPLWNVQSFELIALLTDSHFNHRKNWLTHIPWLYKEYRISRYCFTDSLA